MNFLVHLQSSLFFMCVRVSHLIEDVLLHVNSSSYVHFKLIFLLLAGGEQGVSIFGLIFLVFCTLFIVKRSVLRKG